MSASALFDVDPSATARPWPAARVAPHPRPPGGDGPADVAGRILAHARHAPTRPALVTLDGAGGRSTVTYAALAELTAGYARGFVAQGLRPGDPVCVLAPPSARFVALVLAALGAGLPLVLIDGRRAPRDLLAALTTARPRLVIAPRALLAWWPFVPALRHARRVTTAGRVPGATPLAALWCAGGPAPDRLATLPAPDAPAIVSFTSGRTGPPAGVVRTHAVLLAQHRALAAALPAAPGQAHLTTLPLAALHVLCDGGTAVLCPPDRAGDAAALLARGEARGVSGAPAFVRAVAELLGTGGAPAVRHVVVGGGPVSRALAGRVAAACPDADGYAVYGATEAEPIAVAPLAEVARADGRGFLVGRPAADTEVALVPPGAPVPDAAAPWPPPAGTTGEVAVRGPHVSTRRLEAPHGVHAVHAVHGWHRTRDLARVDAAGRLWLVGTVGEAVPAGAAGLRPYEVEAEALAEAGVWAAGLVTHRGAPAGELAVELAPGADAAAARRAVGARLAAFGAAGVPVRVVPRVPVDARHASKVRRADLAHLLERAPARGAR